MTKKLRKRIMLIMVFLLSITYITILAAINIWIFTNTKADADNALRFLSGQHDEPPDKKPDNLPPEENLPPEKPTGNDKKEKKFVPPNQMDKERIQILSSHYILVHYNKSGVIDSIENTLSDSYSDEDISKYCKKILQSNRTRGSIDQLRYMVRQREGGTEIYFIDHTAENQSSQRLFIISIILGIIGLIVFVILSYIISGLMVRPVEETFERQKQFISDASHELKTPITVILSNSELLEDEIGSNQWLTYIKNECDRMRNLVESLLTLTHLEQTPYESMEKNTFSMSEAMLERILPLESIAFEKEIVMNYDIEPNIAFYGVKEQLQQVLTILIDNAINYTDIKGEIHISLLKTSHHIRFKVSNTGDPIPEDDRKRLFERFYRADKSRNRSQEHYGLGLSIAKTIVENHHGKISVQCEHGMTTFTVSLPAK